jgi:transposase-like protein
MSDAVTVALTPKEALASLRPDMIDAAQARAWVLLRVSPAGATCPGCGELAAGDQARAWREDRRVRCKACGRFFTNRSATLFDGCALGWRDLYLVLVLIAAGCTADEIAPRVGVHPRTIVRMQRRLLVAP